MESIFSALPVLLFAFCFGGAFLLAGGLLLLFALRARRKSAASLDWPSTEGTVISSQVQTNTSTDEEDRVSYSFSPRVEYAYIVNGQEYRGRRLHYGVTESRRKADAEHQAIRYPPGMKVKIFYNPANPQEAVLEQRSVSATLALVLGIIFIALSVCTCLVGMVAVVKPLFSQ